MWWFQRPFSFFLPLAARTKRGERGGNGGTDERGGNSLWFSFLVASSASSQNWKSGQRKEEGGGWISSAMVGGRGNPLDRVDGSLVLASSSSPLPPPGPFFFSPLTVQQSIPLFSSLFFLGSAPWICMLDPIQELPVQVFSPRNVVCERRRERIDRVDFFGNI